MHVPSAVGTVLSHAPVDAVIWNSERRARYASFVNPLQDIGEQRYQGLGRYRLVGILLRAPAAALVRCAAA